MSTFTIFQDHEGTSIALRLNNISTACVDARSNPGCVSIKSDDDAKFYQVRGSLKDLEDQLTAIGKKLVHYNFEDRKGFFVADKVVHFFEVKRSVTGVFVMGDRTAINTPFAEFHAQMEAALGA